jgi:hypothetical protein
MTRVGWRFHGVVLVGSREQSAANRIKSQALGMTRGGLSLAFGSVRGIERDKKRSAALPWRVVGEPRVIFITFGGPQEPVA